METPQDLANEKLKLEIELLRNKVKAETAPAPQPAAAPAQKPEEGKLKKLLYLLKNNDIQKWSTILIGILSFVTLAWSYIDTIKSHFNQLYQQQVISWGSEQSNLINELDKGDLWNKRKAALMLAHYDVNTLDYLVLKLRVIATENIPTNVMSADDQKVMKKATKEQLFYAMKLLKENNNEKKFDNYLFNIISVYQRQDKPTLKDKSEPDDFYSDVCELYYNLYGQHDAKEYISELKKIKLFYIENVPDTSSALRHSHHGDLVDSLAKLMSSPQNN